ncbi:unnamed protein product, partial [marine sediment metagenome]
GRCHVSEEKVQEIYKRMASYGLINHKSFKRGVLHFPNFSKRADNYTKYIKRDFESTSKQLSQEEKRIEEKRKEENRGYLELFSNLHKDVVGVAYPPSFGKDKKLLYGLMDIYDSNTLNTLMKGFFEGAKDPAEWWFDKTLNVGMFKTLIPQIITRIRKKK